MAGKKKSKQNKGSKTYRIEFTRLSLILWGGGFLFGLFWIFVFGILVGRGFLPEMLTDVSDIRSQLSAIQDMMSREGSDELGLSNESETELEMGFYKNLSGKKEDEIEAWAPKIAEAQYTVQLASLGEEAKAHEMVEDLEKSGYPAYIHEREVKGKTYYRVNCGIFTRKGAAENYAEELSKKKGISGLVMRLSVNDD